MSGNQAHEAHDTQSESASTSNKRSIVLFVLLAIMIVAITYDYKVARPAVEQAYDSVVQRNIEINADPTAMLTPEIVADLLAKTPVSKFQDGVDQVEVYAYSGGLPFKPHNLYIIYRDTPSGLLMSRAAKFVYDSHHEIYDHDSTEVNDVEGGQVAGGPDTMPMPDDDIANE